MSALYDKERVDDGLKFCARCNTPLDHLTLDGLCPRCVALDMFTPVPDAERLPGGGPVLSVEFERPRFFGKYEILEEIARGGMGMVYRARQSELDRIVAIKTIVAGVLAGDEAINRFQREAKAAASLSHPNIVTIHEVGLWQGQHYCATEYVSGPNLPVVVRDGPLPAKRAAAYLRTVAEAVEYAHGRGVLHRDLKPSNILLDEQDRPQITDFGLAKRLDARDMTLSGQVLGTPAYTAPEQAGRKSGTVGPQSDVYGLRAILYQLITGRPPFTGESATEILAQVRSRAARGWRAECGEAVGLRIDTVCWALFYSRNVTMVISGGLDRRSRVLRAVRSAPDERPNPTQAILDSKGKTPERDRLPVEAMSGFACGSRAQNISRKPGSHGEPRATRRFACNAP